MNYKLIKLFNKALETPCDLLTFKSLNEKAIKCGYLIHPDCCGPDVEKFLKNERFNPNSTFYKTFEEVASKNKLELAFDQWKHYASTYGSGITTENNGFTQNENPAVIEYSKYKVIMPASKEAIFEDCYNMLKSGIALSSDTLNLLMEYIKEYKFLDKVDVDEIANKEAQAIYAVKTNSYPKQPISILRVLMYLLTEDTAMLVKSNQSIEKIKNIVSDKKKSLALAHALEERETELSSIFYRYKPLFLAMKCKDTASSINRIRKLAVKNHKPMKVGFWEKCLNPKDEQDAFIAEAKKRVNDINSFKKAQLMQSIKERLICGNSKGRMFVIRNGKTFVREDYKSPCDATYLSQLYNVLEDSLIETLKAKAVTKVKTVDTDGNEIEIERPTKICLPTALELTLPTSEKNFIGNFPMGTSIQLSDKDNVIGVYWRGCWGVDDYDLHYVTNDGHHISWNSDYSSDGIIFSGDMTRANPEAAECFYVEKNVPDGLISLSKYSGSDSSKFKLFVAVDPDKSEMKQLDRDSKGMLKNAMVDPNKIVFEAELAHEGQGDKVFAKVQDNKLYMMNVETGGSRRVASVSMNKVISRQTEARNRSYISLNDLLTKSGFEITDDKPDIDFTQLSKNDLINLIS